MIKYLIHGHRKLLTLYAILLGFVITLSFNTVIDGKRIFIRAATVNKTNIFSKINDLSMATFDYKFFVLWALISLIGSILLNFIGSKLCCNSIKKRSNLQNNIGANRIHLVSICIFISICLLWLPYLLTYYPGGLYSDTNLIIAMAKGTSPLTNHHPVLYTMLWRLVLWLGTVMNIKYTSTIFLYTLIQLGLVVGSITYFLTFVYKQESSKIWFIVFYLYFVLNNIFPLYVVSLWKDTIFSSLLFILSTFILKYVCNDNEKTFDNTRTIVNYTILSTLLVFSRNNGIYIFGFFSLLLCLYVFKRSRSKFKKVTLMSISLLAIFALIQGPLFSSMGLNKDGKVETLGMPLQQTAYIVSASGTSSLSNSQKHVLNNIMEEDKLKDNYRPLIVDNIKWSKDFNQYYFNHHYKQFVSIYRKLVLMHPVLALRGLLLANEGFWDPFKQMNVSYICNAMWPGTHVQQHDYFKEKFNSSLKPYLQVKLFISAALYIWLFLTEYVLSLHKNGFWDYRNLLFYIGIALILTLWLATPIAYSMRYAFAFPFLIALGIIPLVV